MYSSQVIISAFILGGSISVFLLSAHKLRHKIREIENESEENPHQE